jgi:hypothetical protein
MGNRRTGHEGNFLGARICIEHKQHNEQQDDRPPKSLQLFHRYSGVWRGMEAGDLVYVPIRLALQLL